MPDWTARQRRKQEVRARAAQPDPAYARCKAIGCPNPARAGTTDGLGHQYCRTHYDHLQRHGSAFKPSYKATDLNPYRQSALLWMLDHPEEFWVKDAVSKVQGLYQRAGPHVEAFRLRGLPPRDRARAHWARLRKHEVDPRLAVGAWLAVAMIVSDDPQPDSRSEFRSVQAAKVVHRMASGTHKRWVQELASGTRVEEVHAYPRPRGRVLRHIGEDLKSACESLSEHHLESIHAFKLEHDRTGTHRSSPYPKGWSARKRKADPA